MTKDKTGNSFELAMKNDIRSHIFTIRGVQVMMDRDLAIGGHRL